MDNIYIDSLLLVAFAKYILSQIYSHFIQNGTFQYFWRLWKLLFFEKNIIEILLYFYLFIQKAITSMTEKYLVVESCPTPQWITFLMFYRLLYNILSYLNNMISAWRAPCYNNVSSQNNGRSSVMTDQIFNLTDQSFSEIRRIDRSLNETGLQRVTNGMYLTW